MEKQYTYTYTYDASDNVLVGDTNGTIESMNAYTHDAEGLKLTAYNTAPSRLDPHDYRDACATSVTVDHPSRPGASRGARR